MFRYSICDPLKPEPIEMGDIEEDKVIDILNRFPWTTLLDKMDNVDESEIHYSPSLEFENKNSRHGLSISIVGDSKKNEFYIFYKRPKAVSKLFGLIKDMDKNFVSDRTGQTIEDVQDAVSALIDDDVETLEKRWG